jgi:hypothetical protein
MGAMSGTTMERVIAACRPGTAFNFRAAVFLLIFMSYGFFATNPANVNTVSRLSWAVNLVERGTLNVDYFADAMVDKAEYKGHFYSDKAPGVGFLALPIVYVFCSVAPVMTDGGRWNVHADITNRFRTLAYLCGLLTSALVTAIAAVVMLGWLERRCGDPTAALIATLCYAIGTPTWGWASSSFGHACAGAFLFLGFVTLDECRSWRGATLGGVLLGLAVSVEFTAGPVVFLIMLHRLWVWWRCVGTGRAVALAAIASVAIVMSEIPLFIYNYTIFGSPFHVGYSNVTGFDKMNSGFFGISLPQIAVIQQILIGPYRGLLRLSPILILVPLAIGICLRLPRWRGVAVLCMTIAGWYVLMNAGYAYWDGGASLGPRHVTAMLPFLGLVFAPMWLRAGPVLRGLTAGLLVVSVVLSMMCVAVDMSGETQSIPDELFGYVFPEFFAGHLIAVAKRMPGLAGISTLLPLLGVWVVLGSLISINLRRRPVTTAMAGIEAV